MAFASAVAAAGFLHLTQNILATGGAAAASASALACSSALSFSSGSTATISVTNTLFLAGFGSTPACSAALSRTVPSEPVVSSTRGLDSLVPAELPTWRHTLKVPAPPFSRHASDAFSLVYTLTFISYTASSPSASPALPAMEGDGGSSGASSPSAPAAAAAGAGAGAAAALPKRLTGAPAAGAAPGAALPNPPKAPKGLSAGGAGAGGKSDAGLLSSSPGGAGESRNDLGFGKSVLPGLGSIIPPDPPAGDAPASVAADSLAGDAPRAALGTADVPAATPPRAFETPCSSASSSV
mmetsp:Transcript_13816/g.57735  ORF Transcript_13816/g.57735 Transcript_13816/m.57735 type:complete len:296 (-) Transcript_13816:171-1058(-)